MMMISNLADPPTKIPVLISNEDQQLILQALLDLKKVKDDAYKTFLEVSKTNPDYFSKIDFSIVNLQRLITIFSGGETTQ